MPATWDVIIFDRYHHRDPDGEFLIEGFPNRELAREYATRRVRDSIEGCRTSDQSEEEIRKLWNLYGESACVVGDDGYPNEIDTWLSKIAKSEQRDWQATLVRAGLPT
ncbi:MAG: hypothetical protein JRG80_16480 [Deltaproteobacteria bacterium]|nr:hypothetical protein [Deltaproteobacteria bacterium]